MSFSLVYMLYDIKFYDYSDPTATIFKSNEGKDSFAPYIASFSSTGPNAITPDILKVTLYIIYIII